MLYFWHEQVARRSDRDVRTLTREEQDRVARALIALLRGSQDDFRLLA